MPPRLMLALAAFAVGACDPIQRSHIAGNEPSVEQADSILRRDLSRYFAARAGVPVRVKYAFLRRGPTQSGAAYPKFYLWVVARDTVTSRALAEGAVRVAAIERARIEVTHFLPRSDLARNPESADSVFPSLVVAEIKKRL